MNMTTVPSNQLKAMQQEIESLKEQVAYLEELNRKLCDKANQLTIMDARAGETIAQQAEAIRVKDAALDWCIGEFNLRLYDIDLSQETIRVRSARHIQPSPEILQDRDERVAANQAGGHNVAANTNSASTSASDLPNTAAIVAISGKPRSNSSRSV